jgi:hypothetical protein
VAEACLYQVELGPRLALELQEEEPLKHLLEDTDNGDWAEVTYIPSLIYILTKEIYLRLVLLARRPPLLEALIIEVK